MAPLIIEKAPAGVPSRTPTGREPALPCAVATSRWHLTGALLLLILGVAVVALALTGDRQGAWWASALPGLVITVLAGKWLRDRRDKQRA